MYADLKSLLGNLGDDVVSVLHADHGEKILGTKVAGLLNYLIR